MICNLATAPSINLDHIHLLMTREIVKMEKDVFNPVRKTVAIETTVVWKNVSSTAHIVTSVQFHNVAEQWHFRTQTLRPNDSAIYAFDQEGIYEYYCGLQGEDMCGVILVGDVSLSDSLPCE